MSSNGGLTREREERIDPLGIRGAEKPKEWYPLSFHVLQRRLGLKLWLVAWGIEKEEEKKEEAVKQGHSAKPFSHSLLSPLCENMKIQLALQLGALNCLSDLRINSSDTAPILVKITSSALIYGQKGGESASWTPIRLLWTTARSIQRISLAEIEHNIYHS